MIPVMLNWRRDALGYRLADMGRYGQTIIRNGGEWIQTTPLVKNEMLYAEFAGVRSPEHVLNFANRHGYLAHEDTPSGGSFYPTDTGGVVSRDDGYSGEKVEDILEAARLVRQVMKAENSGKKSIPLKDALILTRLLEEEDVGRFRLIADRKRGFRFIFEATSLLNAIWIQLANKAAGGVKFGTCRYCGAWFEMGPGTDKRADSQFCKTSHRVAFNRQQQGKRG
ncbi:hypothetical protein [Bradyrhizobium sp. sBnM-33]|uniref:hypothetical protein n=1 Tax=Bradyrhizobium sp. sBnM-33 TaxID=2831780 RepID=UPI001BCED487|nr:hypothetical protein [Bradyrhizobium sp. sBnM-33]WOH47548.1 hypothetical protein RX328_25590 [Bradyrhizobium sp. sBnM-33]